MLQNINAPDGKINTAITRPVTLGTAVTRPENIATRDISYIVECIRAGRVERRDIRALISTIRALPNPELASAMKRELPWFSASLCEGRRQDKSVKLAWFALLDLDHVEDIEALKSLAIQRLPWVRYAFQSVRDGVKIIAEFRTPITREEDFRRLWAWLASQVENILKHPVDPAPDWSRACFFSYDPRLLVNPNCKPLEPAAALRQVDALGLLNLPKRVLTPSNPATLPTVPKAPKGDQNDFERATAIVQKLATLTISYHDWYRVGLALYAGFGESARPLWNLFQANPNYRDSQRLIDAKWRSFRSVREITLATLFEIGARYGV